MLSPTTLLVLGTLVASTVGQAKYGPYKGPPVVPVILPGGFLADTKEVAAAKEYFLNALAKTAAEVKDDSPKGYYNNRAYQAPQPSYQQPTAPRYQPQTQPSTPAFQPQPQRYTQQQSQPQRYTQPQPQAGLFRPQTAYRATPVSEGQNNDDGEYREEVQYQYINSSPKPDPQVTPIILENGYIADTHEVNAAKADHFAAVARAQEAVARAQERARAAGYSSPQYSSGYQAPAPAPPPQKSYSEY